MDKSHGEIVLTGIIVDNSHLFTLEEIKEKLNIEEALLQEMFAYGLFEPASYSSNLITVDLHGLRRIQTAIHLHNDLEINLAGAALALELMDELEDLRTQMSILNKQF